MEVRLFIPQTQWHFLSLVKLLSHSYFKSILKLQCTLYAWSTKLFSKKNLEWSIKYVMKMDWLQFLNKVDKFYLLFSAMLQLVPCQNHIEWLIRCPHPFQIFNKKWNKWKILAYNFPQTLFILCVLVPSTIIHYSLLCTTTFSFRRFNSPVQVFVCVCRMLHSKCFIRKKTLELLYSQHTFRITINQPCWAHLRKRSYRIASTLSHTC